MIHSKLCMVGAFAVGKSSLVRRYVESVFSEDYHTTVGVKVDRKDISVGTQTVRLMLWDLAGEDAFARLRLSYLRGASGYILVADGTRRHTLDVALDLHQQIRAAVGQLPWALVLNKDDLADRWEIDAVRIGGLEASGTTILRTSARSGTGVDALFAHFAALRCAALA